VFFSYHKNPRPTFILGQRDHGTIMSEHYDPPPNYDDPPPPASDYEPLDKPPAYDADAPPQYEDAATPAGSTLPAVNTAGTSTNSVVIVNNGMFGHVPQQVTCSHCQHCGVTRVTKEIGAGAWIITAILFFALLILFLFTLCPCCCFAVICLFLDPFKDTVHHCENCGQVVGKKPMM